MPQRLFLLEAILILPKTHSALSTTAIAESIVSGHTAQVNDLSFSALVSKLVFMMCMLIFLNRNALCR